MSTPTLSTVLTPSEIVFLQANTFAPAGGLLDKYKVVDSAVEVSKKQLAHAAYVTAFLAAESAGAVTLAPRAKKALLGLRSVQTLYVEPCQTPAVWPRPSLEDQVQALAGQLQARKAQNEASNVVYAILEEDEEDPLAHALDLIRNGLAQRGLVERTQEKKLKIFTVSNYHLPESTVALASAQAMKVQEMLAACRQQRGELWALLNLQVEHGIRQRKKAADTSTDD